MESILAVIFLLAFCWIAGSNLHSLILQLRNDGQGPSFIFLLGPLMAMMFLFVNPWGLKGWWWALPLSDVGLWILLIAVVNSRS